MIRLGVLGGDGRMGAEVVNEIYRDPHCKLTAKAKCKLQHEFRNTSGVLFTLDPMRVIANDDVDVVIDFTSAAATPKFARLASRYGKRFLSGTTGLDERGMRHLRQAAKHIPLFYAPNTDPTVAAFRRRAVALAREFAHTDCEVEILDDHHKDKKDAPSGTAQMLSCAIVEASEGLLTPHITSIRDGDTVGTHTVTFKTDYRVEAFQHVATDRSIFARGALEAALWLYNKPPGFYQMDDLLPR